MTTCDDVEIAVEATDDDIYYDAKSAVDCGGSTKSQNGHDKHVTSSTVYNGQADRLTDENNIHRELTQELSECLAHRVSGPYEIARNVSLFHNSPPPTHYEFAHTLGFDTSVDFNRSLGFQRPKDHSSSRTKSRIKSNHSFRESEKLNSPRNQRQTGFSGERDNNESVYSEPLDSGFLLVNRSINRRHMSSRRRLSMKHRRPRSATADNNERLRTHPDFARKSVTSYDVTDRRGKSIRKRQSSTRKGRSSTCKF